MLTLSICGKVSRLSVLARHHSANTFTVSRTVRQLHHSVVLHDDRLNNQTGRTPIGADSVDLRKTQYGVEVYVGSMSKMVRNVKLFSLSTSMMSLAAQPYLLSRAAELPLFVKAVLFGGFSFIFCTPLLLHVFTRQYVTSLHYDAATEQFTAIVYNLLLRRKVLRFTAQETKPPKSAFSLLANCEVHGLPLYFHLPDFIDLRYYEKMMRYIPDKDLPGN